MKNKGFTYIELMIAFAVFAMLLVFAMQLDHTAGSSVRYQNKKEKMLYVAQMAIEKYKTDRAVFEADNYEGYYVKLEKKSVTENAGAKAVVVTEIKVTVKQDKNDSDVDSVVLFNHFDSLGDIL